MSTKETGGPAFPLQTWDPVIHTPKNETGMTLRDYFAAAALPSIIAIYEPTSEPGCIYDCAESAYIYADAMLKTRQ